MIKQREELKITCPSCGTVNLQKENVCRNCGRIIRMEKKTPTDYAACIRLIGIVLLIGICAGVIANLVNNWGNFTVWWQHGLHNMSDWVSANEESMRFIAAIIWTIVTLLISAKISHSSSFSAIYWVTVITAAILLLIIDGIEAMVTGENPFDENLVSVVIALLLWELIPSSLLWSVRKMK